MYEGQKIGFCCEDCIAVFKANPDKYMATLKK
jgi:YHS domain-containing protein